jgi:hypothetical protein
MMTTEQKDDLIAAGDAIVQHVTTTAPKLVLGTAPHPPLLKKAVKLIAGVLLAESDRLRDESKRKAKAAKAKAAKAKAAKASTAKASTNG